MAGGLNGLKAPASHWGRDNITSAPGTCLAGTGRFHSQKHTLNGRATAPLTHWLGLSTVYGPSPNTSHMTLLGQGFFRRMSWNYGTGSPEQIWEGRMKNTIL